MEIGGRLRNARTGAGLTQEQAAEALGVSRQTISNWETEKTYPDIISVIKMSDLYRISLDSLLKEGKPAVEYLKYLEESTNVVKSRKQLTGLMIALVYLAVWAGSVLVFWFFTDGSDAMGYSLMFLWVLLPVTAFALSLLTGGSGCWGRRKWLAAPAFGALYMLAEYATFGAANTAASGRLNAPEPALFAAGTAVSLLGIGLGCLAARRKSGPRA